MLIRPVRSGAIETGRHFPIGGNSTPSDRREQSSKSPLVQRINTSRPSTPPMSSVPVATLSKAHEWMAVRVPGPPSRQPRFHRTVRQGKSWHAKRASGGRPRVALPEMARNDRTAVECNGRGGARRYYRVVRAYSLRQVARSSAGPVAVLPRRGLSREMGRLRRLTRMRPLHRVLQGDGGWSLTLGVVGLRGLPSD